MSNPPVRPFEAPTPPAFPDPAPSLMAAFAHVIWMGLLVPDEVAWRWQIKIRVDVADKVAKLRIGWRRRSTERSRHGLWVATGCTAPKKQQMPQTNANKCKKRYSAKPSSSIWRLVGISIPVGCRTH